mmetsp:Transcript_18125/g.37704  ORF Transcript_18125/g.37704 Transcript_18125/m.37704 type:complete len:462 (-) Transcript_18125:1892-3277(-)
MEKIPPEHAVASCLDCLTAVGFRFLRENENWDQQVAPGGAYVTTRNQSSIVAFVVGDQFKLDSYGFKIIGAHTDSPCLKVKPIPMSTKVGYWQVGVECYGGGLWYSWFDRDLTIAGRALVQSGDSSSSQIELKLVHVKRPILRIPSLAIHLHPELRDGTFKVNKQTHLLPIIATEVKTALEGDKEKDKVAGSQRGRTAIIQNLLANELGCSPDQIVDAELCLTDTQPAAIGGVNNEFIFSPRLDNLASCWAAMKALIRYTRTMKYRADQDISMICFFDHEEVGSSSSHGAGSPLLLQTMRRIDRALSYEYNLARMDEIITRSFLISADMAHAVHPNYTAKHEDNHKPALHGGVVIKTNQNQRYATTALTSYVIRELAKRANVPVQEFVVPNDSPCGSTIGPIIATSTGIPTVDLGQPQLSMHSCREMCGRDDMDYAERLFHSFFADFRQVQCGSQYRPMTK